MARTPSRRAPHRPPHPRVCRRQAHPQVCCRPAPRWPVSAMQCRFAFCMTGSGCAIWAAGRMSDGRGALPSPSSRGCCIRHVVLSCEVFSTLRACRAGCRAACRCMKLEKKSGSHAAQASWAAAHRCQCAGSSSGCRPRPRRPRRRPRAALTTATPRCACGTPRVSERPAQASAGAADLLCQCCCPGTGAVCQRAAQGVLRSHGAQLLPP